MKQFVKRYASEAKAVRLMREDITQFARACGCTDETVGEIEMACGEAFINAVEHGHVPNSSVDVSYSSDERGLTISIKDAGGGIDPSQKTWKSVVDKPHVGGYGRIMMGALMHDVLTHIDPGDGTTVVMRKDLAARPDCPPTAAQVADPQLTPAAALSAAI